MSNRHMDQRVLVAMDAGIGNAVEATPLVQAIRSLWPSSHITILTPPGDLFDGWCVVDKVLHSAEQVKGLAFSHAFAAWMSRTAEYLDSCEVGSVHLPECLFRKWFLKPEREYDMDMVRRVGYRGATPPRYVSVAKPSIDLPPNPIRICLVPGGLRTELWRHKCWPYYAELSNALRARLPQAQVCILGGEGDYLPEAIADHTEIVDLRGRLTLRETAWVLRESALAIGNDCGPMHIADAVQTPGLVIFGPTCELKNGPMNRGVVLAADVPCRPCQHSDRMAACEDPRCMTELAPELVLEEAAAMIQSFHSGRPEKAEGTT